MALFNIGDFSMADAVVPRLLLFFPPNWPARPSFKRWRRRRQRTPPHPAAISASDDRVDDHLPDDPARRSTEAIFYYRGNVHWTEERPSRFHGT
jgi:hypothetical protein